LNLKYDGPLSSFAFDCNLRHYIMGMGEPLNNYDAVLAALVWGCCNLTPGLKVDS